MAYQRDAWKDFGYELDRAEHALRDLTFPSAFKPAIKPDQAFVSGFWTMRLTADQLLLNEVDTLLNESRYGQPHGPQLFIPNPLPQFPSVPKRPTTRPKEYQDYVRKRADEFERSWAEKAALFAEQHDKESAQLAELRSACSRNDPLGVRLLMALTHIRHPWPSALAKPLESAIDFEARTIICTVELPDFSSLKILKKRGPSYKAQLTPVTGTEKRRACETILYASSIRTAYLIALSDIGDWFDTVTVNVRQSWFDSATGAPKSGIIASLQASKFELSQLSLAQVDPKACFRHLKGISTPSVDSVTVVRPIAIFDTDDNRIVESRDVAGSIDEQANLATMDWDDFEHLVRQLFEWEFSRNGIEVKVTRASRDRGVDAIMYDPDPLKGGKFVLQAKRYTRTVDVAAVRDLYGTVMNEGANRGILVTTSSYGPDAYEFARGKPLSLVDGPNLIALLKKHGRNYRINLVEARRAQSDDRGST